MGSTKKVLVVIHDSDDEDGQTPMLVNGSDVVNHGLISNNFHPSFWEEIENKKVQGAIDPDMHNYYKEIGKNMKKGANQQVANQQSSIDPSYEIFIDKYVHGKALTNTPGPSGVPTAPTKVKKFREIASTNPDNFKLTLNDLDMIEYLLHKNKQEVTEDLLFRGPCDTFMTGKKSFDEICMFGNDMYLTKYQQIWLEDLYEAAKIRKYNTKFYVHRMTNSNVVDGKCKMDIGAKFSKMYLHEYLQKAIMVHVESFVSNKKFNMKIKIGLGKSTAMMTTDWGKAVKEYRISEKEIWLFNFYVLPKGGLGLLMAPLP